MCCFSGHVEHVVGTKIFARDVGSGRQALAYSMRYSASGAGLVDAEAFLSRRSIAGMLPNDDVWIA